MSSFNGTMSLEPRLAEYIEKKRYYSENDITPPVPLEVRYDITNADKSIIRAYLRGDKKHMKEE